MVMASMMEMAGLTVSHTTAVVGHGAYNISCSMQSIQTTWNADAIGSSKFSGVGAVPGMQDLLQVARAVRADQALAVALRDAGWTTTKLGALKGVGDEVLDGIAMKLELVNPAIKVNVTELEGLVDAANDAASMLWAVHGGLTDTDLALASRLSKTEANLAERRKQKEKDIGAQVVRIGKAKRARWPTREKRLKAGATDENQREMIEKDERSRWLRELRKLVADSKGGVDTFEETHAWGRRIGKGRRANTLRKHVKVWTRYVRWLLATYGVKWPEEASHFANYLESRASEPCGRSIPESTFKTLMFMEHAAEIPKEDQLSGSIAVKNAMEEIVLQLDSENHKPTKQATPLLIQVVSALERKVMEEEQPRYVRGFA